MECERQLVSDKHWRRLKFRCIAIPLVLLAYLAFASLSPSLPDYLPAMRSLQGDGDFEKALDSDDEWQLMFYFIGIMYLFLSLAVVVDEFFVPALMVLCSKDYLDLGDDVAGATFMAAGGSAPELFTSFIGTFQESDVGFGTIVGSAVFNVLFVIGMCAVFSSTPLQLTWWPLFRDCCYYVLCLVVLYLVFGPITSKEIHWWEAGILLLLYGGYVYLMKTHLSLYTYIMKKRFGKSWEVHEDAYLNLQFSNPSTFRAGIVKLMTSGQNIVDTAGIVAVVELQGDLKQIFDDLDSNENGVIEKSELASLLEKVSGKEPTSGEVEQMFKEMKRTRRKSLGGRAAEMDTDLIESDGALDAIGFHEFSHWYVRSEKRIEVEMERTWTYFDTNNDGMIDEVELRRIMTFFNGLQAVGKTIKPVSPKDLEKMANDVMRKLDKDGDKHITKAEFMEWYKDSMFWQRAQELHESEDVVMDPISLTWPDANVPLRAKVFYLITLPIVCALLYTLPDVQKPGTRCGREYRHWSVVTFAGSIMWIGIFSYFMVEWATVIGDTLSIPPAVMGLTFLAAGTSVPDLLSSVIVAKQGRGDMAVSSSIGSNIFDITVGLPLPWISYCAIKNKHVTVAADSLSFSILLLLAMLVAVVVIVHLNEWIMTNKLGYTMFILYVVFVIQDLVFNFHCDSSKKSYFDGC